MNGQIVLCKGVNDGEELERSIRDLTGYLPMLKSVSVVPVGLTKYREGLYPMTPFTKEDAREVIRDDISGRRRFIKSMERILSMQVMNGICWQRWKFRRKKVMMVICSWRMELECCGF